MTDRLGPRAFFEYQMHNRLHPLALAPPHTRRPKINIAKVGGGSFGTLGILHTAPRMPSFYRTPTAYSGTVGNVDFRPAPGVPAAVLVHDTTWKASSHRTTSASGRRRTSCSTPRAKCMPHLVFIGASLLSDGYAYDPRLTPPPIVSSPLGQCAANAPTLGHSLAEFLTRLQDDPLFP
jgi:hypothetical protein